eukprot:Hpha_TRINITY_DN11251_c0_g1::TRINITY_DN11251_c0_g1_i1::g.167681::m.167681
MRPWGVGCAAASLQGPRATAVCPRRDWLLELRRPRRRWRSSASGRVRVYSGSTDAQLSRLSLLTGPTAENFSRADLLASAVHSAEPHALADEAEALANAVGGDVDTATIQGVAQQLRGIAKEGGRRAAGSLVSARERLGEVLVDLKRDLIPGKNAVQVLTLGCTPTELENLFGTAAVRTRWKSMICNLNALRRARANRAELSIPRHLSVTELLLQALQMAGLLRGRLKGELGRREDALRLKSVNTVVSLCQFVLVDHFFWTFLRSPKSSLAEAERALKKDAPLLWVALLRIYGGVRGLVDDLRCALSGAPVGGVVWLVVDPSQRKRKQGDILRFHKPEDEKEPKVLLLDTGTDPEDEGVSGGAAGAVDVTERQTGAGSEAQRAEDANGSPAETHAAVEDPEAVAGGALNPATEGMAVGASDADKSALVSLASSPGDELVTVGGNDLVVRSGPRYHLTEADRDVLDYLAPEKQSPPLRLVVLEASQSPLKGACFPIAALDGRLLDWMSVDDLVDAWVRALEWGRVEYQTRCVVREYLDGTERTPEALYHALLPREGQRCQVWLEEEGQVEATRTRAPFQASRRALERLGGLPGRQEDLFGEWERLMYNHSSHSEESVGQSSWGGSRTGELARVDAMEDRSSFFGSDRQVSEGDQEVAAGDTITAPPPPVRTLRERTAGAEQEEMEAIDVPDLGDIQAELPSLEDRSYKPSPTGEMEVTKEEKGDDLEVEGVDDLEVEGVDDLEVEGVDDLDGPKELQPVEEETELDSRESISLAGVFGSTKPAVQEDVRTDVDPLLGGQQSQTVSLTSTLRFAPPAVQPDLDNTPSFEPPAPLNTPAGRGYKGKGGPRYERKKTPKPWPEVAKREPLREPLREPIAQPDVPKPAPRFADHAVLSKVRPPAPPRPTKQPAQQSEPSRIHTSRLPQGPPGVAVPPRDPRTLVRPPAPARRQRAAPAPDASARAASGASATPTSAAAAPSHPSAAVVSFTPNAAAPSQRVFAPRVPGAAASGGAAPLPSSGAAAPLVPDAGAPSQGAEASAAAPAPGTTAPSASPRPTVSSAAAPAAPSAPSRGPGRPDAGTPSQEAEAPSMSSAAAPAPGTTAPSASPRPTVSSAAAPAAPSAPSRGPGRPHAGTGGAEARPVPGVAAPASGATAPTAPPRGGTAPRPPRPPVPTPGAAPPPPVRPSRSGPKPPR